MLNKQMFGELLNIREKSLENYLVRATQQTPHKVQIYDLLWKYYEKNNNHSSAAKILNTLAVQPGYFCFFDTSTFIIIFCFRNNVSLKQRLEYLARAVMCMRSDKVGYAPHLGVFLRELEDKIDIARVQEQILNCIIHQRGSHQAAESAVTKLNSNLYDITQVGFSFYLSTVALNNITFLLINKNIQPKATHTSTNSCQQKQYAYYLCLFSLSRQYHKQYNSIHAKL